jgi:uncharacterized membrane protein
MEEVRWPAARRVALIAMMGALSNALFALSATALNWGQVALDLSSMGIPIASLYGGPLAGLSVGVLAGSYPAYTSARRAASYPSSYPASWLASP